MNVMQALRAGSNWIIYEPITATAGQQVGEAQIRSELQMLYSKGFRGLVTYAFDNGREHYDEGRVLEAGGAPVAFEAEGWRIGLSVCYDLRFPELYRALMRPACDLIGLDAIKLQIHCPVAARISV